MFQKIIITFLGLLIFSQVSAQIEPDTTQTSKEQNPDLIIQNDTTSAVSDSIALRQAFIRDSLIAREAFVADSLQHRKLVLDSVSFLKQKLPKLIAAALKSSREEIIIYTDPVNIIGDSMLSNFTYRILAQKIDKPYAPWRSTIKLSGNSLKIKVDTVNKTISALRLPGLNYSFNYGPQKNIIVLNGRSAILRKKTGNYYKSPIDSVFFDRKGQVRKVKKYARIFEATKNYRKGALLYTDIEQVKEFTYFPDKVLSSYRLVNYCGRETGKEKNGICHSVSYTVSRQARNFTIVKKNEPKNVYSDGTFTYEFNRNFDMKRMEFTNGNNSINRNCIIELNKDRYVSRYLYEKNGRINKTILVNYNDKPDAKHKVETVVCYFEDDGISYYQKNTTTGKSRTRNKLTMIWNPWK